MGNGLKIVKQHEDCIPLAELPDYTLCKIVKWHTCPDYIGIVCQKVDNTLFMINEQGKWSDIQVMLKCHDNHEQLFRVRVFKPGEILEVI